MNTEVVSKTVLDETLLELYPSHDEIDDHSQKKSRNFNDESRDEAVTEVNKDDIYSSIDCLSKEETLEPPVNEKWAKIANSN